MKNKYIGGAVETVVGAYIYENYTLYRWKSYTGKMSDLPVCRLLALYTVAHDCTYEEAAVKILVDLDTLDVTEIDSQYSKVAEEVASRDKMHVGKINEIVRDRSTRFNDASPQDSFNADTLFN